MSTTTQPAKPKRRWFRFSLRTLLLVMLLFTVTVGWIGARMQQARRNRDRVAEVQEAVAAIETVGRENRFHDRDITRMNLFSAGQWGGFLNRSNGCGGYNMPRFQIFSEYEIIRPQTWFEKQFDDPGPFDDPVRRLRVRVVNLVLYDITDAELQQIDTLVRFASLNVNSNELTPSDLENLKGWAHRARMNRETLATSEKAAAVAEIRWKMGGEVRSLYKELRSQTWSENLFDDPGSKDDPVGRWKVLQVFLHSQSATDTGLMHLKGLKNVQYLDLGDTKITDAGLAHLQGLTNLQHLVLWNTNVRGAGLEHLKGLTELEFLNLDRTNVSDEGLEHLAAMTNLHALLLRRTNVTDAGLTHLAGMTSLFGLILDDTRVTDEGLEHMAALTNLHTLYLRNTKVTDEGVKKLQQALPQCEIYR